MFNHSGITVKLMDTATIKEPTNSSPIMLVGTNASISDVEIIVKHKKMTRRERRILRRTAAKIKRGLVIKSVSVRKR